VKYEPMYIGMSNRSCARFRTPEEGRGLCLDLSTDLGAEVNAVTLIFPDEQAYEDWQAILSDAKEDYQQPERLITSMLETTDDDESWDQVAQRIVTALREKRLLPAIDQPKPEEAGPRFGPVEDWSEEDQEAGYWRHPVSGVWTHLKDQTFADSLGDMWRWSGVYRSDDSCKAWPNYMWPLMSRTDQQRLDVRWDVLENSVGPLLQVMI
jgi:hypothetical protein